MKQAANYLSTHLSARCFNAFILLPYTSSKSLFIPAPLNEFSIVINNVMTLRGSEREQKSILNVRATKDRLYLAILKSTGSTYCI